MHIFLVVSVSGYKVETMILVGRATPSTQLVWVGQIKNQKS